MEDEIAQHQQLHPPRDLVDRPGSPEDAEVSDVQNSQRRDTGRLEQSGFAPVPLIKDCLIDWPKTKQGAARPWPVL